MWKSIPKINKVTGMPTGRCRIWSQKNWIHFQSRTEVSPFWGLNHYHWNMGRWAAHDITTAVITSSYSDWLIAAKSRTETESSHPGAIFHVHTLINDQLDGLVTLPHEVWLKKPCHAEKTVGRKALGGKKYIYSKSDNIYKFYPQKKNPYTHVSRMSRNQFKKSTTDFVSPPCTAPSNTDTPHARTAQHLRAKAEGIRKQNGSQAFWSLTHEKKSISKALLQKGGRRRMQTCVNNMYVKNCRFTVTI